MDPFFTYVGIFVTAVISAAGGAAFAWAKTATSAYKEARERAIQHDKAVDTAMVIMLRSQLVEEHDKLMAGGWADHTRRQRWKEAYNAYETLCELSGTPNGVMTDYLDDIRELPTSKEELHESVREGLD